MLPMLPLWPLMLPEPVSVPEPDVPLWLPEVEPLVPLWPEVLLLPELLPYSPLWLPFILPAGTPVISTRWPTYCRSSEALLPLTSSTLFALPLVPSVPD